MMVPFITLQWPGKLQMNGYFPGEEGTLKSPLNDSLAFKRGVDQIMSLDSGTNCLWNASGSCAISSASFHTISSLPGLTMIRL